MVATRVGASTELIDELREEEIVNKVGGRFKLTALIQKGMLELMDGARPLVTRRALLALRRRACGA